MGRIRRFGKKIVKGLKSIREEANHPGRPPGHKVSENKYWEEDAPKDAAKDQSKEFWFLDGTDADGWEETNPGGDEP